MGYSLHDCKLKNQMLTSKPMYEENKCMWVTSPGVDLVLQSNLVCVCVCACSQDLKLVVKQALELLTPSSLQSFGI
jgi:hypothetical protein